MRSVTYLLRSKTFLASLCMVLGAVSVPARADEAVRAVWKVQEIYLSYFGLTTHYSCDGLREKMRGILEKLGVREDFVVSVGGCIEVSGPTFNPMVRMIVANAVPATDEAAREFAADPKRASLAERLQKKSKTPYGDEPFDAIAKRATLFVKEDNDRGVGGSGDCELLEQVRRFVLPKLGAVVSNDSVRCTPHQGIVGNPHMDVELLVAVPAKS